MEEIASRGVIFEGLAGNSLQTKQQSGNRALHTSYFPVRRSCRPPLLG